MFGMLPKSRPELINKAWSIYRIGNKKQREKKANEFVQRYHNMWCRVHFIGAWDTVAALGLPTEWISFLLDKIPFFKHSFHSLDLSESIRHARHALAIDDERRVFQPTIWNNELTKPDQTLKQVWFLGSHSDVGGGSGDQSLPDIALIWMISEAVKHGLWIYPGNDVALSPDPNGKIFNSRGSFFLRFYTKQLRSWNSEKLGKPTVHESVLLRTESRFKEEEKPYKSWILEQDHLIEPWPDSFRGIDCFCEVPEIL